MLNSRYDNDPEGYSAKRTGWLHQRRQQRVLDFLSTSEPGDRVLDLGCGTGNVTLAIADARPDLKVVGIEPLDSYITFAKKQAEERGITNAEFAQGCAENLGTVLEEASVDWILTNDVLHHVSDERLALAAVAQASKPGARWLAIEPNRWNPYMFLFQGLTKGERNFHPPRFAKVASTTGWQLAEREYLFLIPTAISSPKPWMKRLEETLERQPVLGGGVAIRLVRSST